MFVACWSVKGGAGTTVVAVAMASCLARSSPGGALLVDLAGDAPAALGIAEPETAGLSDWLAAGEDVPADALHRLELDLGSGLALLARGTQGDGSERRAEALAAALAAEPRPVVADCGLLAASPTATVLAGAATQSLLVTRACYLGLRRALSLPIRPSGVVLITEPGRALTRADVEHVIGAPVRAEIALDPAVARAVDAGFLSSRLPRALERALRHAA